MDWEYLPFPGRAYCLGLSIDGVPPTFSFYANPQIPADDPGEWHYTIMMNGTEVTGGSFYILQD
jgi:hypothetical protein